MPSDWGPPVRRCRTCRWWRKHKQPEQGTVGRGLCELARSLDMEPVHPDSLAVALDEENLKATLETDPEFGCVQWQAREGE